MGEYQGIWRLPDSIKKMFTPLIEIPEIGWDFKEKKENKTIDEHLSDFALKKIYKKWGNSSCFVDLNLIDPSERMTKGTHPAKFLFRELRKAGCSAIPVTGLDRDKAYQQAVKIISTKCKSGVCLRISIEEAAKNSFQKDIDYILSELDIQIGNSNMILDLGTPNFQPLDGFSKAIQMIVSKIPYLKKWRTFSIIGTSFPETMASIKKGGEIVPRYEWQLYKRLIDGMNKSNLRLPTFGDYAISHPNVLRLDMRVVKPSATIRYAIDDGWFIVKGENVRDEKYGKFKQYRGLSKTVVNSQHYYGPTFSWGDKYISECADGNGKTGHLPMWRQVGTNHHIEKVVQDIASFYDS